MSSIEWIKERSFPWRALLTAILICGGGSFHSGYQLTILNPTERVFRTFINDTVFYRYNRILHENTYRLVWTAVVTAPMVGNIFGTLMLVRLAEKLGRRRPFYISSIFVLIGLICQALSKSCTSYELLTVGRLLTGVGSGLSLALEGVYFNEISPMKTRGFFCSITGAACELGFIIGGIVGLSTVFGTCEAWPLMFIMEMMPTLILFVTLPFMHGSPRFLLAQGNMEECKRALIFFGHKDVNSAILEIQEEIQSQQRKVKWRDIWKKRHLRRATFLSTFVVIASAMSGSSYVNCFSTYIFTNVGLSVSAAEYASLTIFLQAFLATFVGLFIIDKVGRRSLLLSTTIGMIILDTALMCFSLTYESYKEQWAGYASVASCIFFALTYGIGLSNLQWTVTPEMVPLNARSRVQFIVMFTQKIFALLGAVAFFPLQGLIGSYCFLLYILTLCICCVIFWKYFPETNRKTVVEVMQMLGYDENEEKDLENVNQEARERFLSDECKMTI